MYSMTRKRPGRPKRLHKGVNLNIWIDGRLAEAFERFIEEHRPRTDKTAAVEHALEKMLTELSYWPPPAPPAEEGQ
jgi:hypothetical protein